MQENLPPSCRAAKYAWCSTNQVRSQRQHLHAGGVLGDIYGASGGGVRWIGTRLLLPGKNLCLPLNFEEIQKILDKRVALSPPR